MTEAPLKIGYVHSGKVSVEIRHMLRDPIDLTVAMLTVFLVLRAVYSILAGWIAGRLSGGLGRAPRAVTLLLLLTGIVAQLVNRGMYPLWYHIVFLASIVPCVSLGLHLGANSNAPLDARSREA